MLAMFYYISFINLIFGILSDYYMLHDVVLLFLHLLHNCQYSID